MATTVLDLDLAQLPACIDGLEAYAQAFVLIRFRGQPVGQAWLPVSDGRIAASDLSSQLVTAAGWPLCISCLCRYLEIEVPGPPSHPLPSATIAVCTRDRPEDLQCCLQALMELPDQGQEILVVDNASRTDETCQVAQGFARVRYVREERPGLNIARNRALREARHDVVAFIDDDAVADPGWLAALLPNFDDPLVLCVTGLTMPLELETDAQEWFQRYAPFGRGFHRRVFDFDHLNPSIAGKAGAGVNMALRRTTLELVGSFDEALDTGTPTKSGGDTEMLSRILLARYRIVYDPAALSWHRHRRSWEDLRQVLYSYGAGIYAFWTRRVLYDREFGALKPPLYWFAYDQFPDLIGALRRRPESLPLDLRLAELRGCLAGPWAYVRSRRDLDRSSDCRR